MSPRNRSVMSLVYGGMLAALVFISTYLLKLPVPMTSGYVHLGDGFILLGASVLGWISVPAAAIGSMLADILLGYAVYAPITFIIKGASAAIAVMALKAGPKWLRAILIAAVPLFVAGAYYLAEWLALGIGSAGAAANLPGNLVQGLSALVVYCLMSPVMRNLRLMK